MDRNILERVLKATQLTKLGRLQEATSLLLRRGAEAPAKDGRRKPDDVIDATWTEVDESREGAGRGAAASAASTASTESGAAAREQAHQQPRQQPHQQPPQQPQQQTRERSRSQTADSARPWSGDFARGKPAPASGARGLVTHGKFANAAGERAYQLYIPSTFTNQALPLVVMLHGCNQTAEEFATATRMNEAAEQAGCFVLYPAQSGSANHSRCWNWFRKEDQRRDAGEPSILAGMTRDVAARYGMDTRRVYAAGLSAGGAMAAVLGSTYPDLFAAIGIHSGLAFGSAHDLPSALAAMQGRSRRKHAPTGAAAAKAAAVPTIVFHGDQDGTVHPDNGAQVIARSGHHGHDDNEVTKTEGRAPGGRVYTKTIHRDANGRIVLEHWSVHGGGHAWFGGQAGGSYTDPQGPDATQEMMRFFLQSAS